jgi:hypothetical protein
MCYADFSVRAWVVLLVISLLQHWRMLMILCCFLPPASALRQMLVIFDDDLASEFHVAFNASKSNCVTFPPRYLKGKPDYESVFHAGNNVIANTQQWLHFGHILTSELKSHADMAAKLTICCISFGCELWFLHNVLQLVITVRYGGLVYVEYGVFRVITIVK